ncbi:hypothetical protein [Streptomyces sp. NBC_00582]|uniref:hypothetical protein n=1 Tax=Streptomyces sp. NBC_00582 TaxID=2975783 RepID=UPI002E7FDB38|nr:hypothetical protein [Streptomyces sp. NBC_00582]WUB61521.1 hypothetical protein OG852_14530 [Streptomyces sp. NBC_00582]
MTRDKPAAGICGACRRLAPDGHHLCPLCADDVRGWLAEIPGQVVLLAEALAPAGAPGQGRGGSGRAHSPLPVDVRALVLLGPGHAGPVGDPGDDTDTTVPIGPFLAAWAGVIAYGYPSVGWHPDRDPAATLYVLPCDRAVPRHGQTITHWCAWLTAYVPYAVTLPAAAELHRQLGALLRRIRRITHTEPRTHPREAPCPACQTYRLVSVDGQDRITCKACGHSLTPAEYDQHTAALLSSLDKDRQTA